MSERWLVWLSGQSLGLRAEGSGFSSGQGHQRPGHEPAHRLRVPGPLQPARHGSGTRASLMAGLEARLSQIFPSPCATAEGTHLGPGQETRGQNAGILCARPGGSTGHRDPR